MIRTQDALLWRSDIIVDDVTYQVGMRVDDHPPIRLWEVRTVPVKAGRPLLTTGGITCERYKS